ncbi:hypothetical protein F5Y09DRAFT_322286 [Xylaria sp. FL1042]|nr:hypothetical protein F5Y09DRAFT_322286 [Xylaria sp. FL1042]
MSSFHHFPHLPSELRLEIWRAYFADCHGTQIHIFLSTSSGPKYINQDATTGAPGWDTLAAAGVSADSWAVFQESFYVGDMRSLYYPTNTSTSTSTSTTITTTTTQRRLRFAVSADDMLYVIDTKVSPLLTALSRTPWIRRARRLALQVFNFHTPAPNPDLLPDPRPYPHNLDYWGRNWVLWNKLLSSLPPSIRALMAGPALTQLLFVVVPNREVQRARPLKPNLYGFVVLDPASFTLGSADEIHAVHGHAGLTYARLRAAFPGEDGEHVCRKIGYVADAVPARAEFTCLDTMYVTSY